MCRILNPSYIVRVSWVYEDDKQLFSVVGKVNENNEPLSQWRKWSNPSSVTRIRVVRLAKSDLMLPTYFLQMLEVAKAIRYFHSMGIVFHHYVDSVCI
jgi:serine/threonine protein kinase